MRMPGLASLSIALLIAGCATTDADDGRVAIATQNNGQALDGARCTVSHRHASWDIETPAAIDIGRADGNLRILCMKPGYRSSELLLPPYEQPTGSGFGFGMGAGRGNVGVGRRTWLGFSADG